MADSPTNNDILPEGISIEEKNDLLSLFELLVEADKNLMKSNASSNNRNPDNPD